MHSFLENLLARLIAWNQYLNENCHWELGWRSQEAKDKWVGEASSLAAELKEALAGMAIWILIFGPNGLESWAVLDRLAAAGGVGQTRLSRCPVIDTSLRIHRLIAGSQ